MEFLQNLYKAKRKGPHWAGIVLHAAMDCMIKSS